MRISRQFGANNALRQPSLFSPQALLGLQSAGGVSTALSGLDFNVEPLEKRELLHGGSHQSPEAMNDHFVYTQQQSSYSLDVLSNDVDPNGDSLVIVDVSQPKYGTVEIDGEHIAYTPNPGVVAADDAFTYLISDGTRHDVASVTVSVEHECIDLPDPTPVEITIHRGTSAFDNEAFVYSIDEDGSISNIQELGSEESANGVVKYHVAPAGTTFGIGIRNDLGEVFYSSGYGDNQHLNPDGIVHTTAISQNADDTVTFGFEDLFGGGDLDFDDIIVNVHLRDSGATMDNAHFPYVGDQPDTERALLANGSFERGVNTDGYEWYDPSDIPGWATSSTDGNGTLEIVQWPEAAADGNSFIELDRYGQGVNRIHQYVPLSAGETYLLSFDLSSKRHSDYAEVDVRIDGQSLGMFSSHNQWNRHIAEITATESGLIPVEFIQTGGTDQAARLDNIQLYSVGANLVANPNFSSPHGHGYYEEDHVPNWDVPGTEHGRIKIVRTTAHGQATQYARLDYRTNATTDHIIEQTIDTTRGQEYVLRFDSKSHNYQETFNVVWEGNVVATIEPHTNVWTSESLVLVASSNTGSSTLRFEQVLTSDHYRGDVLLDNIGLHELDCMENLPPTLDAISDQTTDEGVAFTLVATATDPDLPADSLTFSLDGTPPTGLMIDPVTGEINWTPTEEQGPGTYDVTVVVTDSAGEFDSTSFQIEVLERNLAPTLAPIADQTVNEGVEFSLIATATDPDLPANDLTFSLDGTPPAGLTIDPATGEINWTPTEEQGPGTFEVTVVVTDSAGASDSVSFQIEVLEQNVAPVLDPIADVTIDEETFLNILATGSDSDLPENDLRYRLVSAPEGATITGRRGRIRWTPTEVDGPGTFEFRVQLSDGELTDEKTFFVTVNEVNQAPTLTPIADATIDEGTTLSVTATATDVDLPANMLTYSLVTAPTGATIDATTGQISWGTTADDGAASYRFTVQVSDGELTDQTSFNVAVNDLNTPPVLDPIDDKSVDETARLNFLATASDANPGDQLKFRLVSGPAGATITQNRGRIRWTPSETDGPGSFEFVVEVTDGTATDQQTFTVNVNEVNQAPVLQPLADISIDENESINVTAMATDADLPANTLTYNLATAPTGAMIDPTTGQIEWDATTGPGTFDFIVEVSDGDLTDQQSFQVEVLSTNQRPDLAPIADRTIDELTQLNFLTEATDPDPADALQFSLVSAPTGATITGAMGRIRWTPTEADGPGVFEFVVSVTDGELTDEETFTVTVDEVNLAPVLAPIADITIDAGQDISLTAMATDGDLPANTLMYSFVIAPPGATIDAITGEIAWTSVDGGAYDFIVQVTDNGGMFDTEDFTVNVNQIEDCLFEPGDWTFGESGGLNGMAGSGVAQGCTVVLEEGNSFEVLASISFDVPQNTSHFVFEYSGLNFDGADAGSISDAFEAALVDANGNSLVHTIGENRDAFFNTSESPIESAGANTVVNGNTISVDLTHLTPGTTATLRLRLVNNDNDTNTRVTVKPIAFELGSLGTPLGVTSPANTEILEVIDFSALTDVTGSLQANFQTTSFNAQSDRLFSDITFTNNANHPIDGPFILVVSDITDPTVVAAGTDGVTPDGDRYYQINDLSDLNTIAPGTETLAQTIEFLNPNGDQFDFKLTVLAQPNVAPQFVSTPATEGTVDTPYVYDSDATDADNDTLTYTLMSGPSGLAVDPTSGVLTWTPTSNDVGTYSVMVEVEDGRGGRDQQRYTIDVVEERPNRPPVIISTPVVETYLSGTNQSIATPTTIGVWSPTRGGVETNYISGTALDDLRTDLATSFPNGNFLGSDALTDEFLGKIDVLAIHAIADAETAVQVISLSAAEQSALFSFVENGGSALILAENTGDFGAISDSLLAPFGMDTVGTTFGVNRATPTNTQHPIFNGPFGRASGYDMWFPSYFSDLGDYGTALALNSSGNPVAAAIEPGAIAPGSGAVLAFTDTLSGYPLAGGDQTERQVVFKNALAYLGGDNFTRAARGITLAEFIELTPTDIGSISNTNFSTLPSDDAALFGLDFDNVQVVNFDEDPLGNPIPSGSFITTQYESIGLVLNNFQVYGGVFGGPASAPNATFTPANPGEALVFDFVVPVAAAGFINTSPDQDAIEFLDSEGRVIFATTDQAGMPVDFNVDRFLGVVADPARPIASIRVANNTGNLELDELIFAPADASYQYQVEAVDADFDPIRYVLDESPQGMTINSSTGQIYWNPKSVDVGTHTVRVIADDGRGGTATQEYELRVLADPTNTAPVIVSDPVEDFFIPGFSNPASGDVTPQRISLDLGNGETFDGTVSIVLPETAGRYADIVLAVDESGSMSGDQAWVAEMIPLLDTALVNAGIGADPANPNRFGIIGFGGGRDGITVGHFLNAEKRSKYTLYGPGRAVVMEGFLNDVIPDELLNLQLPADGQYVLVVEPQDPNDLDGGIDIGFFGNNVEATRVESLELNTYTEGVLFPGQPVEYTFNIAQPTTIYFDSLAKDARIQRTLIGPNGEVIGGSNQNFDLGHDADNFLWTVAPGDYTLLIDSSSDVGADYQFQMLDLSDAPQITSGQSVSGEFELKKETFAYRFDGEAGKLVQFLNSTAGVHSGSQWRIVDSSNTLIARNNIGTNQTPIELKETGEHYLLMESAFSPKEGTAQLRTDSTFQFTLDVLDPIPPTPVVFGQTITVDHEYIGAFVDYTFDLSERALLYVDALGNSGRTWTLSGPTGTVVNARRFDQTDSFNIVSPALDLVPGTYSLRVDGNGQIGEFDFRVLDLADATNITPGIAFDGELTVPSQTNMYRFDGLAGETFYFDVIATSDINNSEYKLIDPFGQVVFESTRMNDRSATTLPADGTYTLLVEGWRANVDQDTYTFNVVPVATNTVPLTLGAPTNGTLSTPGERIDHTFTITDDYTLVHFDSLANRSDVLWTLEGPLGVVYENRPFHSSDANVTSNTSLPATAFELMQGDYQFTVFGSGDAIGDFAFNLISLSDPSQSTLIDNPVSGSPTTISNAVQSNPLQSQAYRFDAVAGDAFSFDVTTVGSIGSDYRLLDPFGRSVFFGGSMGDQPTTVVEHSGTYYLLVQGRINNADNDEYSIVITHEGNTPPTPLSGTAYTLGTPQTGDLSVDGQVDSYLVTLTEPTVLYIDALTNNSSIRHRFSGPRGVEFDNVQTYRSDSFDYNGDFTLWRPGTYQLDFYASSGAPGAYAFNMSALDSGIAITPGIAFSGELTTPNETDIYNFDAQAGDQFYFDVEAASDTNNTEYKLIDPFGRRVFTSNRLNDRDVTEVTQTGTYSLLVEGWRGNTGTDTYTMNVHKVVDTTTALTLGEVTQGELSTPGERAHFTFSTSDWTLLHFDSFVNDSALTWTLTGPAGTEINARRFNASDSISITNPVIEVPPGEYTLTIDGTGVLPRTFQFALLDLSEAQTMTPGTVVADALDANLAEDATWTNGVALSGSATNGAIDLSRPTDGIRLPHQALDGLSDFTVEFWYKTEKPGFQTFLSAANASTDNELLMYLDSDTEFVLDGVGTWNIASVADNQWHHYAVVHEDGIGTTFYLDGASQGVETATLGTLSIDPNGLVFGQEQDAFNASWDSSQSADGQLDELRIWSSIRSASDVVDNQDQVVAGTTAGLNAYYRFDDASGNSVADQSANALNATFESFAMSNASKMYSFDANTGDRIFIDFLNYSNFRTLPYYRLVTPYGQQISRPAASVDLGPITLEATGTYTLFVEGNVSDTGLNGEYSFEVVPLGNVNDPVTPTPMAVGDTIDSETSVRHETDSYSFTLDSDSLVYFDSFTNDSTLTWTLKRGQRTLVNARRFDLSDSSGNADPVLRLDAGDYVLSVTSSDAEPYSFRLQDLTTAIPVDLNTPFAGELTTPNQTDIYSFSANANELIYVDVVSTTTASSSYYKIINSRGQVVIQRNSLSDLDVIQLEDEGTYWLLVEGRVNQTVSNSYDINLVRSTVTELPLAVGTTQTNTIAKAGDTFEYTLDLTEDSLLVFDSQTSETTFLWSLEGPTGQVVSSRRLDLSDSSNITNPLLNLSAGQYKLTVDATSTNVGEFAFRLLDSKVATPVVPGTSFSGEFTTPNATDLFQFTASAGDQFLVDIETIANTGTTIYRIVDPAGNIIEQQSNLVDRELAPFTLTGTYTILVEPVRTSTTQGTYSINLRELSVRDGGTLNLGVPQSGSLTSPNEEVTYSFNVADDFTLHHFDSLTNDLGILWSLDGPRGNVYSNLRFSTSDSTATNSTSSNPTTGFELMSGDYTLTIRGNGDRVGDFAFTLFDLSDPAQSTLVADPVSGTPTTINGPQTNGLQTQIYRFNAVAGDQLSFDATVSGSISSDYRLLDPYGRQVFSRFLTQDQASTQVALTGTYYLLVEGRISNASPDDYSIVVTHEGNVAPPPISGDAYTLGAIQSGNLSAAGQVDAYSFTLTDKTVLYFDSLTNNGSIQWRFKGPRGTEFENVRFDRSDSFNLNSGLDEWRPGTYFVEVYASSGTPGAYSFRMSNPLTGTSITPGTAFSGELTTPNQTDIYNFTAQAGDEFFFNTEAASDFNGTEYKLLDPFGKLVFISNRLNDQATTTVEFDGTYTLLVEGGTTNTGTDTYTMNVVPVTNVVTPLSLGESLTATIATPAQTHTFNFAVTDKPLFFFSPLSTSNVLSWEVAGSQGNFVAGDTFNRGKNFTELKPGDYQLTVRASGDFVGDAEFFTFLGAGTQIATDGTITTAQLDSQSGVELFTFTGNAGDHFALTPDFGMQFTTSDIAAETATRYIASADPEDGYSGINAALRADVFREGAAVNYILVTDEDRDVAEDDVTFESLFRSLTVQNALVNMVTTSTFQDGNNQAAIGVDSEGNAYIADGAGGFTIGAGGTTTQTNVSFRQDYIDLAWALGGANWNLNLLRSGGLNAESFTNAFVDVKVDEILAQTSLQLLTSNPNASLEVVAPATGVYENIVGGQQYDFDIRIDNLGEPISYDLLFSQGQTVGSIPVYIIAPYQYGASAVDADGDTLQWSIVDGPEGLLIDSASGLLAWHADGVVFGEHPVTIRVDDGRGGFDEQTFTLNVNGGDPSSISGSVFDFGLLNTTTVDVIVEGTSDPYLAGMPDGSLASNGDIAPTHSPVLVEGLVLQAGQVLTFNASGQVSFGGTPNPNETPDGKLSGAAGHTAGAENGISNLIANYNSLVGVFLTDAQPDSNPAPGTLDFINASGVPGGINYTELAPELQQAFFIGDGITDDGTIQEITVPAGATRLYLGTWDGFGWYNNQGFFDVQVTGQTYAPTATNLVTNGSFESPDAPGLIANFSNGQSFGNWTVSGQSVSIVDSAYEEVGITFQAQEGNQWIDLEGLATQFRNQISQQIATEVGKEYILSFHLGSATDDSNIFATSVDVQIDGGDPLTYTNEIAPRSELNWKRFEHRFVATDTTTTIAFTNASGAGNFLSALDNVSVVDASESFTVFLDQNRNGLLDDGERFTTTDTTGQYSFENLDAGSYVVTLLPQAGWQQVIPNDVLPYDVDVAAGDSLVGIQFGVEQVVLVNTDPLFASEPSLAVVAGDFYEYTPVVTELDGDTLEFDLPLAPAGMVVNPVNGTIRWTPRTDQIGTQNVLLRVRDGNGGYDLQYFQLNVTAPNTAPVFVTTPITGPAGVGLPLTYSANAVDADGDVLTYSLTTAPTGATIDATTGVLNWTPTVAELGSQSFTIRVEDARGLSAEQSFDLNVELDPVNTAPVFVTEPPTEARLGDTYFYKVQVSDANGDPLTLTLDAGPAGMLLSPDGLLTWTPGVNQLGNRTVRLTVDDGRGGTARQQYVINAATQPVNNPPVIVSEPLTSAVVDINYQFTPIAEDANNDTLTWQLVEGPRGMTIDSSTGQINWLPLVDDLGTHRVTIEVFDTHGTGAGLSYDVTVRAINTPPIILSAPPTSTAIGATYLYQVAANDADQDRLTFSLDSSPSGMVIDAETGRITWSPIAGQDGTQDVIVTVTDSAGASISQSYQIQVAAGTSNQLPVITSSAIFYATVGEDYTYDVEAEDLDGDDLTYALLSSPTGMTIDAQTGLIQWTPATGDIGSVLVEVLVTDQSGGGSLQGFGLQVQATNTAPVITSTAPTATLSAGEAFRYDLLAIDAEGDFLTYELLSGPTGMVIDGLGRMFWIATSEQFGANPVEVVVTDTRGATATQTFDIVVEQDTTAPTVAILLSRNPVNVGELLDIQVSAFDNVGVDSIVLTVDGAVVQLDANNTARIEMSTVGSFVAEATVADAEGNTTVEQVNILVSDPNDVDGPILNITSPTDGGLITGPTDVIGTVDDDTLVSYTLTLIPINGSGAPQIIATGSDSVNDDVLGTIDPTLLPNGSYELLLQAIDASGNTSFLSQNVEITGQFKVGNYRLNFIDAEIKLSGIPVTIYRTYDSLNANQSGDFGFGWSLSVWDTNLTTNLPPTGLEDYGIYTPFTIGTRVYVTRPDGVREGFTFNPSLTILPGFGNSLVLATPRFTPDPGVTSTLSVGSGRLIVNEFGELTAGSLPWNPSAPEFGGGFNLTTGDGMRFRIDGTSGQVSQITDRNGNTLRLSSSGITSSTGVSVDFQRDTSGRISKIIAPNGSEIDYGYSNLGDLVSINDLDGNETTFEYSEDRAHFLDRVIDPLGRVGQRTIYDENGRLTQILNNVGDGITLSFDPESQVQTVTDALGNPTTFVYDESGNVTTTVDALGGQSTFTYDTAGNLTSSVDALGNETQYTFDNRGNLLSSTNANEAVSTFTYNTFGQQLTATDPLGNTTSTEYDSNGNITKQIDAIGNATSFSYDTLGNVLTTTNPNGAVSTFSYVAGVLTMFTDEDGVETVLGTNPMGLVTSETRIVTDDEGNEVTLGWNYDFSGSGRLAKVTNENGAVSEQIVNAAGQVISVVEADGTTQTITYDDAGNIASIQYDEETNATFESDALGRQTKATTSDGLVINTTYDALGRVIFESYSNGRSIARAFDAVGNVLSETDETGAETVYEYDDIYQLTAITLPNGTRTTYAYDDAGRRTAVSIESDSVTGTEYDEKNRVTKQIYSATEFELFEYDALDNITAFTDRFGERWQYQYSPSGILLKVIDPAGNETEYTSNEAGTFDGIIDNAGRETILRFNEFGQQTTRILPLGQTETTTYDSTGLVSSRTDFNGTLTEYQYDATRRITSISFDGVEVQTRTFDEGTISIVNASGTTTVVQDTQGLLLSFENVFGITTAYDRSETNETDIQTASGTTTIHRTPLGLIDSITGTDGAITSISYDESGFPVTTVFEDGSTLTREFDALGRTTRIVFTDPSDTVVRDWQFNRGGDGRIDSITKENGQTTTYTYNSVGQLTSEIVTDGNDVVLSTISYAYDTVGNVASKTVDGVTTDFAVDDNDRLTQVGNWTYTYDDNGNLTSRTDGVTTETYEYDNFDRMIRFERTGTDATVVEYEYDYDGLLSVRREGGNEIRFVWDRGSAALPMLLELRDGSNTLLARYENNGTQYTRVILANGDAYQIVTDHLGSAISYVPESGGTPENIEFDAFGNAVALPVISELIFAFGGGLSDKATGLVYMRNRWYDPSTSRFTQTDPANAEFTDPRTLNRYTFTLNDPVNNNDPNGTLTAAEQATVALIVGTLAAITVAAPELVINTVTRVFTGGDAVRFTNETASNRPFVEAALSPKAVPFLSVSTGLETLSFTKGPAAGTRAFYAYIGGGIGFAVDSRGFEDTGGKSGVAVNVSYRPAIGQVFDTPGPKDYEKHFLSVTAGITVGIFATSFISASYQKGFVRQISWSPTVTFTESDGTTRHSHSRVDFGGGPSVGTGGDDNLLVKITVKFGFGYSYYFPVPLFLPGIQ